MSVLLTDSWKCFARVSGSLTVYRGVRAVSVWSEQETGPATFSPTCHEEEQAGHVLGEALLPEEADSGHDAAAQQDSSRHPQEASSDPAQICRTHTHIHTHISLAAPFIQSDVIAGPWSSQGPMASLRGPVLKSLCRPWD